ncbi:MAG: 16S rRNA (cytidine(1402)-2'-O)-methyltransferase, partial [Clostridia bacterium]
VNKRGRAELLEKLKNEERTMIFYEAPHKLMNTLDDMLKFFGNRRISLCRELTKIHEEIFRTDMEGAIAHFTETPPRGEFVLVVEGKPDAEIKEEAEEQWASMSVEEHVNMYMEKGMTEKEAIKAAANDRGVSKRDIYNVVKR